MAVYTCYDMILDCRAGKPAGWIYFVQNFLGACRGLIRHYTSGSSREDELLRAVLGRLQDPAVFFGSLEPMAEREFIARLRPLVMAEVDRAHPPAEPSVPLDLETLTAALEELTVAEKQIVWLDGMRYGTPETSAMMHAAPETVEKMRDKAAELLRNRMDHWTRAIVRENGAALAREAASRAPEEPIPAKMFLDAIDGRITWSQRWDLDQKLARSWHEIDHFCRIREADAILRAAKALTEAEAQPYFDLLGVKAEAPPFWKRILAFR